MIVEVTEEDDEGDAVAKHKHVHGVWEVTLCEQVVACVQEEEQKLHLQTQSRKVQISSLHKHTYMVHLNMHRLFHTKQETHQLQRCEVFFPPQVLLHVRADGSQAIVRIHHYVNEGVDQADEKRCRMWYKQEHKNNQELRNEVGK